MKLKRLIILLLVLGIFFILTSCNQCEFVGNRVANPDPYRLDVERMNGTDTHVMELNAGDILDIRFETLDGKLNLEIKAPSGITIYAGNGVETTDFTVNISESGEYFVYVKANNARGTIYVRRQTQTL